MSVEASPIISYSWFCCLSDHHFGASIRTRTRRTLNATEFNDEESQEQVGEADEEIDAVEAFKVCHTSRKKGMSDVARDVVVSPSTCLFSLSGFI